uniref:TOG domain-containing protein n=1 Tax=Magallana gigas TaxID=29159 RepID=A0A8W8N7N8_MAGGI
MGESPPLNGDLDAELWSSPLMHYTSPFDDYKDLFDQIPKDTNVFQFPDTAAKPTSGPTKLPVPQRSPTLPTSPLCQDTTPCKKYQSVIVAGGMEYDDFQQSMRSLDVSLITSVKDLRSQIVRETCITLAYLSQRMGSRFEHLAEVLLPHLINLIPNSAKVMASSGVTCIYFIIQYTQSSRLIPILISNLSSKSNIIRSTHYLEKHIAGLQDAIKRGISDADAEARVFARKCFWGFAEHFKEQADMLMNALEPRDQKLLNDQCSGSSRFDSSTLGRIGKKKHSNFSSARSDTGAEIRSRSLKFSKDVDVSGAARHHGADLDKTLSKSVKDRIIRSSSAVDLANGMSPSYSSYASPKRRSPQMAAASRMMPGATYSLRAYCSDARGVRLCRDGSVMNGTCRHLGRRNCDSSMYQSLVCVFRGD